MNYTNTLPRGRVEVHIYMHHLRRAYALVCMTACRPSHEPPLRISLLSHDSMYVALAADEPNHHPPNVSTPHLFGSEADAYSCRMQVAMDTRP